MKNILFINFNDQFLINFVHKLLKNPIISVQAVFTDKKKLSDELLYSINYKNIYDFYDFNKIIELNNDSKYVLSKKDIEDFYFLESEFLAESDRMSYFAISVKKRKLMYYEILQYWLNYFKNNHIDLVVFDGVPHMGWDLICYEVARKINIKTCYLELTVIEDQVIWHDDYKSFKYNQLEETALSIEKIKYSIGEDNLARYSVESELLKLGKKLNKKLNENVFFNFNKLKEGILSFYALIRKIQNSNLLSDSAFFYNRPTIYQYLIAIIRNKTYLKRLNFQYKKLSKNINLDKKFIFFAMHYQPERTTNPQGECFQEQILAIKIIAAAMPNGWKLYVKEHPTQMINRKIFKNKNFRDLYDYKIINKLNNVELVPLEIDSSILIQKAQLVSTINGSIGWETLNKYHKPVAIFGNIWYSKCNSCFNISSTDDFKNVMIKLNHYTTERVEKDVLNLLNYYRKEFCISSDSYFYANFSPLKKEELIENLTKKFIEKYID